MRKAVLQVFRQCQQMIQKENCINKVLKPGYYIVLDEKNSIHLKDALVEIFKLNKDV